MINLVPKEVKQARTYGRRNRMLVGYCFAVITIGAIIVSVTLFNTRYINEDVVRINSEMAQREQEAQKLEASQKEVDKIAAQIKTVDKLYNGEIKFSELIPKIGNLLPSGVVLNSLTLTGGKTSPLQLDVDMESQDLAATFQKNLIDSDLFEASDIGAITSKGNSVSKPGQKSYSFGATLTVSFKGTAAAKKQSAPPTPAPATESAPKTGGS